MKRFTKEDFISKAQETHGTTYNYNKVLYINKNTPVIITCPIHGDFTQVPHTHYSSGCFECGKEGKRDSKETFVEKATKVHGNKYDYSTVNYTTSRTKVEIKCNRCDGTFNIKPKEHINGKGCNLCNSNGYNRYKIGFLYIHLVKDTSTVIGYKIGITNRSPLVRYKEITKNSSFSHTMIFYISSDGETIFNLEKLIHSKCKMIDNLQSKMTDGFTEVIDKDDINKALNLIEGIINGHS